MASFVSDELVSGIDRAIVAEAGAVSTAPVHRAIKLLQDLDPAAMSGLEIGPLDRPLVRRDPGINIAYLDFQTTDQLRARFADDPGVCITDLCEIDFATGRRQASEVVDRTFDYILASHVFEHVPDPIAWLQDLSSLLNAGGIISLAIPDRRFTFDILRPATSIGEVLEAHYARRSKPSFRSVFDQHYYWRNVSAEAVWRGDVSPHDLSAPSPPASALRHAQDVLASAEHYEDVHCTIVSDREFIALIEQIKAFGLIDLNTKRFFPTAVSDMEFIVHLQRPDAA